MKAVMISVQPKWVEKIASGQKTIEVRKTRPKIDTPFKCYIYCSKHKPLVRQNIIDGKDIIANGKVIGEFVCDSMYGIFNFLPYEADDTHHDTIPYVLEQTCLQDYEIDEYLGNKDGYGWHINDLVIYDEPKELSEFYHACKLPNGTDCSMCLDEGKTTCWSFTRPPQSWCYVEEKE